MLSRVVFSFSPFTASHDPVFLVGLRTCLLRERLLTGPDRGLRGGILLRVGTFRICGVQGLGDEPQHEVPLGELPARALALPLQVPFDPLEQFLRDLKCHRSAFLRHAAAAFLTLHPIVVFLNEFCDVLAGGLAQALPFLADPFVERWGPERTGSWSLPCSILLLFDHNARHGGLLEPLF